MMKFTVSTTDLNLHNMQTYDEAMGCGYRARKDTPLWNYAFPINWGADPYNDINWRYQLHAWRLIDPLLHTVDNEQDEFAFQRCNQIMLDWSNYAKNNPSDKMIWNDMATGMRAAKLAFLYERSVSYPSTMNENFLIIYNKLADVHIDKLLNEKFIKMMNHGIFQLHGLSLLAYVFGRQSQQIQNYTNHLILKIFKSSYTEQGIHKEHSPGYHIWFTRLLEDLKIDRFITDKSALKIIEEAKAVTPWFIMPDTRLAAFGDTVARTKLPITKESGAINVSIENSSFRVGDFSNSGYFFIKENDKSYDKQSVFVITASKFSEIHKHADELSFLYYIDGEPVFDDPGIYSYDKTDIREFIVSTRAHSVLSCQHTQINQKAVPVKTTYNNSVYLNYLGVVNNAFSFKGYVQREGFFEHQRIYNVFPGRLLSIFDTWTGNKYPVESLLQINPKWDINFHGLNEIVLEHMMSRRKVFVNMESPGHVEIRRAEKNPYYGWFSQRYKNIEPCYCLSFIPHESTSNINYTAKVE